jgi:Putative peptidoglycan binding domain
MKRIVLLTCIGTLALALTASGAPREKQGSRSAKSKPTAHEVSGARSGKVAAPRVSRSAPRVSHSAPRVSRSTARMSRSVAPRARTQSVGRASASRGSRMGVARTRSARTAERGIRSARTAERGARTRTADRGRTSLDRERAVARAGRARAAQTAARTNAAARRNLAVNRQRNLTFARNVALNRDRDVRIVNNWRNDRFRGANYVVFYNYNRVWHDRVWWVNNYPRVVFVLGGWWYWNAGYWYPAWGYDPYAWYPYDGPIYTGYADRMPDRIVEDVQLALQQQGYYAGSIDGLLGPQTRGALAAFQADYGLAITSAVNKPTLQTLGLA